MVSMMDCIERIPSTLSRILSNKEDNLLALKKYLLSRDKKINEIVFIASGSSYNSAFVSKNFIEKTTGLKVTLIYPNNFIQYTHIYNEDALYIAISQGGGTKLVYEAIEKLKSKGLTTVSITSDLNSKISKASDIKVDMGCGHEEIIFRTLGFSSSLLVNYLIALSIAKTYNSITKEKYDSYINQLSLIPANLPHLINLTKAWYENQKTTLLKNKNIVLMGADELWATSQEADIKLIETTTFMTKSVELEEAIHGPQNGYHKDMSIFILLDREKDFDRAMAIGKFCKDEVGHCFIVGDAGLDSNDLIFSSVGGEFKSLEYITPFQVLCYLMSTDLERDLNGPIYPQLTKYINKTF